MAHPGLAGPRVRRSGGAVRAGALLLPRILRRGGTPGWAKAAAAGAVMVGLAGGLLAVLTIAGVSGGHLTAPASAS
jgi:hypothetical protein